MDGENMNEHEDMKNKKRRKAVLIVLLILFFVLVLLPFGISIFIYEQYFGTRYETNASMQLYLEEFEDKGHNEIYYSAEGREYMVQINEEFAEWRKLLTYDYKDAANEERFMKDKAAWLEEHLDRARWCNLIDTELFAQMVAFFDENID